jgi:peptidoglycan hydrolase FlgJ
MKIDGLTSPAPTSVGGSTTETTVSGKIADYKRQRDKLKKATQDFEAVFVGMMLKEMRKTMTSDNPLFGNSSQAKYYQEMMDDAVAHQISRTGKFGFGDLLYKKVERNLPPDPEVLLKEALKIVT